MWRQLRGLSPNRKPGPEHSMDCTRSSIHPKQTEKCAHQILLDTQPYDSGLRDRLLPSIGFHNKCVGPSALKEYRPRLLEQQRSAKVPPLTRTRIHDLPTELLLQIASKIPVYSRACLALTGKPLFRILSGNFRHLRLPAEQPQDFQSLTTASKYQLDRYKFICLLQIDLYSE